tara:strand:- start:260 stop:601 length:342 start_codon:yes stop_codon:yes gene_type:complete
MSEPDTRPPQQAKAPPTLTIDWERYGRYLDDSDLTDAQKREFLQTLWDIVVSFVDLGFRLNPQTEVCGEIADLSEILTRDSDAVVRSEHHISKAKFTKATKGTALPARERSRP